MEKFKQQQQLHSHKTLLTQHTITYSHAREGNNDDDDEEE
jgi:hypothetical protein